MLELYTIGYEGTAQPALIQTLLENDIEALIDIRERPQSRKPGFSRTALGIAVAAHGIRYEHIRALGTPRDIRFRRKIDHDQQAFRDDFIAYLATQDEAMNALAEQIRRERCCLMCFEADARQCHRWFVSERAVALCGGELNVTHLNVVPL